MPHEYTLAMHVVDSVTSWLNLGPHDGEQSPTASGAPGYNIDLAYGDGAPDYHAPVYYVDLAYGEGNGNDPDLECEFKHNDGNGNNPDSEFGPKLEEEPPVPIAPQPGMRAI